MVQALAAVFRWLASLKLAVVLILVLAAVLAWATLLESSVGRDYAQWYVYKSPWFVALLAVLGLNILASTLIRFPWIKSRRGFVITHAGLLVLLFGAIQTFRHGVEGQLIFAEGQSVDSILMLDKCQLNLAWQTQPNRSPLAFTFRPGPVDWPPGETLDLGELDGVQLKVLRFLRHAKSEENWVADESGGGGPAIKFAVADPRGKTVLETWLAAGPFGAEFSLGPATFVLQRAPVASLVEDFLKPPGKEMGARGVLSMHLDGRMVRVGVGRKPGQEDPPGRRQDPRPDREVSAQRPARSRRPLRLPRPAARQSHAGAEGLSAGQGAAAARRSPLPGTPCWAWTGFTVSPVR